MEYTNIEKFLSDRIVQSLERDLNYYSDKLTIKPIMRYTQTDISSDAAKILDIIRLAKYESKEFDFLPHVSVEKDGTEKAIRKFLVKHGCELHDIVDAFQIIGPWLNAYNSEGFYYGFLYCLSLLNNTVKTTVTESLMIREDI